MDEYQRPTNPGDLASDEDFTDRFDRAFHQAASADPGAGALDPDLWTRIQAEAGIDQTTPEGAPKAGPTFVDTAGTLRGRGRYTAPAAWWRWGLAAVLVTALASTLVLSLGDDKPSRNPTGGVVDAPVMMSPVATTIDGCDVLPLSVEEVLEIILSVPPMSRGTPYPHTGVWLPDSSGTVDTGDGNVRSVVPPDAATFAVIERTADQYLACQETATNFQLWRLESPAEVQRQVTESLMYAYESPFGPEIDETVLTDEIARLGPLVRAEVTVANRGGTYLTIWQPKEHLHFRANQIPEAAFVTYEDDGNLRYAWIGMELRSKEDGSVVARFSPGLSGHSSDIPPEAGLPALGVLIFVFDATEEAWKVVWFIPSI